jgi:hypothetical protein
MDLSVNPFAGLYPRQACRHKSRTKADTLEQEEPRPSMKTLAIVALKRGVLLYWSLWFSMVLATSVVHGLKTLGILGEGWDFSFGEYKLISSWIWVYGAPAGVHGALLAGVVASEAVVTVLFWRAFSKFHGLKNSDRRSLAAAFLLALALFAAFTGADQTSSTYLYEGTHLRIFGALAVCLVGVYLLPE